MKKTAIAVLVVLVLALAAVCAQAYPVTGWSRIYQGVSYATGYTTSPRLMRAFAIRVDLHCPSVGLFASHSNGTLPYEVTRQTTSAFLSEHGLKAAINTCYFDAGLSPNTSIQGLLISNGSVVSTWQAARDAELHIYPNKTAEIMNNGGADGAFTVSAGDAYYLVNGGWSGDNTVTAPRTGGGISQDGRYLYLVCVDGRQPGWSDGATIWDMCDWMSSFGAYNAMNFDGGGSTTMVRADVGTVNSPSDGAARAVGASLGVTSQAVIRYGARPAVFRAARSWYLRNTLTTGGADLSFEYGAAGDIPVMGDWDGNGTITCGIVRNEGGQLGWHLKNSNAGGTGDINITYGLAGDIPIAGDWDGDGVFTPGVIRGVQWNLRNSNTSGGADIQFNYGQAGDKFVTGDWNNDGVFSPGVVRGVVWLLRNYNSGGENDVPDFNFGVTTDIPIVGDWDGNGTWTCGIVRGNVWSYRNTNTGGTGDGTFGFGTGGDKFLVWH